MRAHPVHTIAHGLHRISAAASLKNVVIGQRGKREARAVPIERQQAACLIPARAARCTKVVKVAHPLLAQVRARAAFGQDHVDRPLIRIAVIRPIDDCCHVERIDRLAEAEHAPTILEAPERVGYGMASGVAVVDIGAFDTRTARARTARIGAVLPGVIDLFAITERRVDRQARGKHLAIAVKLEVQPDMSAARQAARGRPSGRGTVGRHQCSRLRARAEVLHAVEKAGVEAADRGEVEILAHDALNWPDTRQHANLPAERVGHLLERGTIGDIVAHHAARHHLPDDVGAGRLDVDHDLRRGTFGNRFWRGELCAYACDSRSHASDLPDSRDCRKRLCAEA